MKLYQLTDSELSKRCENHVKLYRNVSDSTRLLEELLDRFTKQKNILDEVLRDDYPIQTNNSGGKRQEL